jgi:4-amino-4-deoxy-L-arabinose transferase-like glycosyltransferase
MLLDLVRRADPELTQDPADQAELVPSRLELRIARAVTVVATVWIAVFASWGLFGPVLGGHDAAMASMGIIADNMSTWDTWAPVWVYTREPPDPSLVYAHHPWGIFWTAAAARWVFGRHDFVCRLPAVLLSIATPALIAAAARAIHRPLAGAVAALSFVVLPITLSFAHFNVLEVPLIAYSALFVWGWARFRRTGARRHMAALLGGAALALHVDWPAYVLVGVVLAIDLASLARRRRVVSRRRAVAWAALASLAVGTGVFYLAVFSHYQKLGDLLQSYELRRGGDAIPLAALLEERRYWDELMFTPVGLALGKVGAVVAVVRAAVRRRLVELAPVAVLAMALFQYCVFRQGAAIHVFWPHTFALYFALAMASIAATISPVVANAVPRIPGSLGRRLSGLGHAVSLVLLAAPLVVIARDAVDAAAWARRTGGRLDEKGSFIETDGAEVDLLRGLSAELAPDAIVGLHDSMGPHWAHIWALGGRVVHLGVTLPSGEDVGYDAVVVDLRALRDFEVELLLERRALRVIGPFAVVTPGDASLTVQSFREREPTLLERATGAPFEPVRTVEEDPFLRWTLVHHFGGAVVPIEVEPRTVEDLAAAHNEALSRGDVERADETRRRLVAELHGPVLVFEDGTRLLGIHPRHGVAPRLLLVFAASGPLAQGVVPEVRATMVEAPAGSTVGLSPTPRALGPKLLVPPSRWRPGLLYVVEVDLLPRPGREAFDLGFVSRGRGRAPSVEGRARAEIFRL